VGARAVPYPWQRSRVAPSPKEADGSSRIAVYSEPCARLYSKGSAKLLCWPKWATENQTAAQWQWQGCSGLPPVQTTHTSPVGEQFATHGSDHRP